jgi:HAE1 family hydrophobic/amphiphilic exporter-1
MDIVGFTIKNPVKITVGVLLVLLFGLLALFQIPIQLTPDVDEPRITVTTRWQGKSAREVEREIAERQEEKLKGVANVRKMTSSCVEGQAEVVLEFFVGVDKNVALRDTDAKLNQVTGYPPEAEKPEVVAADAALASPIAWLLIRAFDGSDVSTQRDFVWDEVKPILERVPGLASVDIYGGREREVHVEIDPAELAARGLTLREVEDALWNQNINVSAGTIERGKREYIYRTVGEYEKLEDVENTVVAYREGGPILVKDLGGRVVKTHEKQTSFVRSKAQPVIAMPARRETGANVIEVMEGLKQQIQKVNKEVLNPRGMGLELTQVYDETVYIHSAISLVRNNLFIGGALATVVLLVFLRSGRATAVVALSIPISVVGTCLAVATLGRNINVVMLAGMAFAVGMVVDNAVVVLENIYRHLQMGKRPFDAALEGAAEVWGAVLASTLTTMAVFVPVIFVKEEAGQLFRDIAIAIAVGVGISLIVSVMVIPTISARVLARGKSTIPKHTVGGLASAVADRVTRINRSRILRVAVVVFFLFGSLLGSWLLVPPTDYLPSGNRNLVFGVIITEPGLGLSDFREMAYDIERFLEPYWLAEPGSPEADALPPVQMMLAPPGPDSPPPVEVEAPLIENFFFVTRQNGCFMGATSRDDSYVKPLEALLTQAAMSSSKSAGVMALFRQASLFGRVIGGGNSVEVEIRSEDLDRVIAAAGQVMAECQAAGFDRIQPEPNNFDLLRPEIQAVVNRVKAADVGLNVRDIGFVIEAAVDGAYIGGFQEQGDEVDMRVRFVDSVGEPLTDIHDVPIYTPTGDIVPLLSVVDFINTGAPQRIDRIEEMPGVRLAISPPAGMALESAMNRIENDVVNKLREQGRIDETVLVSMAGNADKLVQTRAAMFGRWTGFNGESILAFISSRGFLALLIVYLLMSALFESFIYPIAIILTVPLAMVGGFAGLRIVHALSLFNPVTPIQQLDVVTMLGFVILLGIVVNNAILIVHQTLNNLRAGASQEAALHEAVRTRVRPIFMTAFTSIGGMLPLAVMTGAGSELYRGLAGVMVGGLLVSTLFTVILVPVVFSWILAFRHWTLRLLGREPKVAVEVVESPPPSEDASIPESISTTVDD